MPSCSSSRSHKSSTKLHTGLGSDPHTDLKMGDPQEPRRQAPLHHPDSHRLQALGKELNDFGRLVSLGWRRTPSNR